MSQKEEDILEAVRNTRDAERVASQFGRREHWDGLYQQLLQHGDKKGLSARAVLREKMKGPVPSDFLEAMRRAALTLKYMPLICYDVWAHVEIAMIPEVEEAYRGKLLAIEGRHAAKINKSHINNDLNCLVGVIVMYPNLWRRTYDLACRLDSTLKTTGRIYAFVRPEHFPQSSREN